MISKANNIPMHYVRMKMNRVELGGREVMFLCQDVSKPNSVAQMLHMVYIQQRIIVLKERKHTESNLQPQLKIMFLNKLLMMKKEERKKQRLQHNHMKMIKGEYHYSTQVGIPILIFLMLLKELPMESCPLMLDIRTIPAIKEFQILSNNLNMSLK